MSQIHTLRQLLILNDDRRWGRRKINNKIYIWERQTIERARIIYIAFFIFTLDEQSAHALLEGTRCNRRTISSGDSSAMTFLLRYDGVVPEFRASPGLDSISPPSVSFVILGSLVCGRFGREWKKEPRGRDFDGVRYTARSWRYLIVRKFWLARRDVRAPNQSVNCLNERTQIVLDIILRAQHNTKRSLSL